jgi:quinol monooxygenase YgiN
VEEWKDDSSLDAHLAARHTKAVLAVFPALLESGPDIRRYTKVA